MFGDYNDSDDEECLEDEKPRSASAIENDAPAAPAIDAARLKEAARIVAGLSAKSAVRAKLAQQLMREETDAAIAAYLWRERIPAPYHALVRLDDCIEILVRGIFYKVAALPRKAALDAEINRLCASLRTNLEQLIAYERVGMHPFLFRRLGRSFHFRLDAGNSVETLLHKSELLHFARFFHAVDVKEGFCSRKTIAHPLAKAAEQMYARRRHARSRGDDTLEQFCKSSLQLMHSATNQRHDRRTHFATPRELRDFLESNYSLSLDTQVSPADLQRFLSHTEYFGVRDHMRRIELRHLDVDAASAVYCLSSGVLANARVKLLTAIERFIAYDSVELCYANTDSVHLSIKKDRIDGFLQHFEDLIGDSLGQMKVETIAERGYWFDVGRYWLLKGECVVQFRNKGFNHARSQDAFVARRKAYAHHDAEAFSHLRSFVMRLENSFNYSKKLGTPSNGTTDFFRYSFEEIKTTAAMNATEAAEILRSRGRKAELFKKLSGEAR